VIEASHRSDLGPVFDVDAFVASRAPLPADIESALVALETSLEEMRGHAAKLDAAVTATATAIAAVRARASKDVEKMQQVDTILAALRK
jgi:hypothetical protein